MRTEPDISREALAALLLREYGVEAVRFTFIPKGFGSHLYAAHLADGGRFFVKMVRPDPAPMVASDPAFYLPLTWNLYHKGLYRNLSYPLRTRSGEFVSRFAGRPLVLFPFIEGETLEDDNLWTDALFATLGHAVGTIHRSTPEIGVEQPFVEDYEVRFRPLLLDAIPELRDTGGEESAGRRALRDALLPHEAEMRAHLDRLAELQARVREIAPAMVVCHTDIHGGNMMLDPEGELYILDWENAMIAPPEHDLFAFVEDPRFSSFLSAYERAYRRVAFSAEVFGFYFYRRNLEDLADWVQRILHENHEEAQDMEDVEWVRYSIAQWEFLKLRIGAVEQALDGRRQVCSAVVPGS